MNILIEWIIENNFIPLSQIQQIHLIIKSNFSTSFLVDTHNTQYIFKILDSEQLSIRYGLSLKDLIFQLEFQEYVIKDAIQEKLAVPRPVLFNDKTYTPYKNYLIFITTYIEGKVLRSSAYTDNQVQDMGQLLAFIHSIDYKKYGSNHWKNKKKFLINHVKEFYKVFNPDQLIEAAHKYFMADELIDFLRSSIKNIEEQQLLDINIDNNPLLVFSHYDIKPKNILWKNDQDFVILDWETSTLMPRSTDYLETLLSFTQVIKETHVELDLKKLHAFKEGYRKIYPETITITEDDFKILVLGECIWLQVNLLQKNEHEFKNTLYYLAFIHKNKQLLMTL